MELLRIPELITWLTEVLDQDYAIADRGLMTRYGCSPRTWTFGDLIPGTDQHIIASEWTRALDIVHLGDPAAALARIEGHRALLALHSPHPNSVQDDDPEDDVLWCASCHDDATHEGKKWPCPTVLTLGAMYAHRAGYQGQWRP